MKLTVKQPKGGGVAGPLDVVMDPMPTNAYEAILTLSAHKQPTLHIKAYITDADIVISDDAVTTEKTCPRCRQMVPVEAQNEVDRVKDKCGEDEGVGDKTVIGSDTVSRCRI